VNQAAAQQSNATEMAGATTSAQSNRTATHPGGVEVASQARSALSSLLGTVDFSNAAPPPPPPSESGTSTDGGLKDKLASALKAKEASDSQNAANGAEALTAPPSQGGIPSDAVFSANDVFSRLFGTVQPTASASAS
jgi:hypothetical protein